MTAPTKLAYTLREAAEQVSVSLDTIRKAVNSGKLHAKRVGEGQKLIRIPEESLRAWLDGQGDA